MSDIAEMIEIDLSGVQFAYVRERTDPEGETEYLLFDQRGHLLLSCDLKRYVLGFAAEYEIPLVALH